jgi:hypothetical protein
LSGLIYDPNFARTLILCLKQQFRTLTLLKDAHKGGAEQQERAAHHSGEHPEQRQLRAAVREKRRRRTRFEQLQQAAGAEHARLERAD